MTEETLQQTIRDAVRLGWFLILLNTLGLVAGLVTMASYAERSDYERRRDHAGHESAALTCGSR